MSDRFPLTEVGGDEIIARVVYQLILLDYHQNPASYDEPFPALLLLADYYHTAELALIAADIRLVAIWVASGGTVATWLRARVVFTCGRATRLARAGRNRRR